MTSIFNRRGSYPDLENKKKTMYRPKNLMFQAGGPMETQQMEQQEQPGQEQGQEQQIMQMVAQALQQGTPPEQVMQMLVQQGIPQEQAQQIIQEVMSQMQGQMSPQQPTNGQPMMQQGGKFNPVQNIYRSTDATYVKPPVGYTMDYSDKTNEWGKAIKPNTHILKNKKMYEAFKKDPTRNAQPVYYNQPLQYQGPYVRPNLPQNDYSGNPYNTTYDNSFMNEYQLGGMRPKGLLYDY